ncbi:MAG: hypothetical protein ABI461_16495 [Polyangiaceae bacterium]
MKRLFGAALFAIAVLATSSASAQQYKLGAYGGLSSGVEGGGAGSFGLRRARTTLRLGGDASVDEFPNDIFGLYAVIEVEPHASFGAEARYLRLLTPLNVVHVGGIGVFAPSTLFGANAGFDHRFALGKSLALEVGPTFQVFFIGGDLPDNAVIFQGLLQVGIHANL